jgi:Flp pilus assembly protein TadD
MYSSRDVHAGEALRLAEREREVRGDLYTDDALAFALYRNGRFAEAGRIIERWRRLGTGDARVLFHRGAIDMALGQVDQGRRLLAGALAQNPKFDVKGAVEAKRLLGAR